MFETAVNFFEGFLVAWVIYILSDRKDNKVLTLGALIVYTLLDFAFICYVNTIALSDSLFLLFEFASAYIYMTVISKDKPGRKIYVSMLPYNTFGITNTLLTLTLSFILYGKIDFFSLMEQHRVSAVLLAQAFHIAVFYVVIHMQKRRTISFSDRDYLILGLIIFVCNLMTVCFESVALHLDHEDAYMIFGIYAVILFIVLIIFLFRSIEQHTLNETKQQLELDILKNQQTSNAKILEMQKKLHELRHDMKHFIQGLKELDKDRDHPEIRSAIEEYEESVMTEPVPVKTPSPALDYVLNIKREEALHKKLDFVLSINLTHPIDMEDDDLYLLMANLLDNAIEHIGMKKRIFVEIRDVKNMLMIRITNSVDFHVLNEKREFVRTIYNDGHGFGIRTIETMLQKYDGFITFLEEDHELIATVLLPLSKLTYKHTSEENAKA